MSIAVRMARREDVPAIQAFLDQHWSRGHVLAHDSTLFDFQHRNSQGRLHLAIAHKAGEGALWGVLGGITNATYDPALADRDTLWLTTWKVRDDRASPGLGLRLHRTLSAALPHQAIGTVGNNEAAAAIYHLLGYQTGTLRQFALVNPRMDRFRLARVDSGWPLRQPTENPRGRLRPLDTDDLRTVRLPNLGTRAVALPAKSPRYFADRYLRHPRYAYQVYGLERGQHTEALLALRVVEHEGSRALRLVDYWGSDDGLVGAGSAFMGLLEQHRAEYLDFFVHGLAEETVTAAGLQPVDPDGATIVPSYFEPFARQNVRLRFAFQATNASSAPVLVKGDADQDRPNRPVPSLDPAVVAPEPTA